MKITTHKCCYRLPLFYAKHTPKNKYKSYIKVNIGMMGCFEAQMNLCSFILGFRRRVEACAITSTWNIYYYFSSLNVFFLLVRFETMYLWQFIKLKMPELKVFFGISFWHKTQWWWMYDTDKQCIETERKTHKR